MIFDNLYLNIEYAYFFVNSLFRAMEVLTKKWVLAGKVSKYTYIVQKKHQDSVHLTKIPKRGLVHSKGHSIQF